MSVFKDFVVFQLIRATDGVRTDAVACPREDLVFRLDMVVNKQDFVLVLHDISYEDFSLHPLMTIQSFLELNAGGQSSLSVPVEDYSNE